MRFHIAGPVEGDQQCCVVCGDLLFGAGQPKVDPGTRIAESTVGDVADDRQLETLTGEDSLPLGIYACKPTPV
jgi:hypothetical protein